MKDKITDIKLATGMMKQLNIGVRVVNRDGDRVSVTHANLIQSAWVDDDDQICVRLGGEACRLLAEHGERKAVVCP